MDAHVEANGALRRRRAFAAGALGILAIAAVAAWPAVMAGRSELVVASGSAGLALVPLAVVAAAGARTSRLLLDALVAGTALWCANRLLVADPAALPVGVRTLQWGGLAAIGAALGAGLAVVSASTVGGRRATEVRWWLASGPVLAAVVLFLLRAAGGEGRGLPVAALGVAVVVLVVVRQALVRHDQRDAADALEATVAVRTAELQRSEQRFSAMIRNVSDLITVVRRDGTIAFVSPSVLDVLGYSEEEAVGQNLFEVVHADDVGPLAAFLGRDGEESGARRVELRVLHGDGSWRDVEAIGGDVDDTVLGGFVVVARDVTQRKVLEQQLQRQALHDPLTGLPNRALLNDRIDRALASARRNREHVALLFLDLDDFKTVNDTLGHSSGDELLLVVAARLVQCLRASDTVARLGGDEFAVLLEGGDEATAVMMAEALRDALARPLRLHGVQLAVSASIGVAVAAPGTTAGELLRNADVAMYHAKLAGKARFAVFRAEMHDAVVHGVRLRTELRRAVEVAEFEVHYQPIVRLDGAGLSGFEALLRWRHPERGLLEPEDFLPVLEQTGLITTVGRWVRETALAQLAEWVDRTGDGTLAMSVNLSARELHDDELVTHLQAVLRRTGVDPACVTLELTESTLLDDAEATVARLGQLKDLGVRLAVDDFGTGFSSLSYLQRFPVDALKIDKSFVDDLSGGARSLGVVRAVVDLGRSLDLDTVAEGIEGAEQATLLEAAGCEAGQGFLFSRPMSASDIELWLGDGLALPPVSRSA